MVAVVLVVSLVTNLKKSLAPASGKNLPADCLGP